MIAYAITDPSTLHFNTLNQDLKHFANKADMLVYRDKETANYIENAKHFMREAQQHSFDKVLLHRNVRLAHELKADGVHLSSKQRDDIGEAKRLGLFVMISTHNEEEIMEAQEYGADMVTYSPIFRSPNKGKPKGVEKLEEVVQKFSIPVIALGGILSTEQIDACQRVGAKGFASIRYFAKKAI